MCVFLDLYQTTHLQYHSFIISIIGKCFLFVSDLFDYDGAYQKCGTEGGRLFEPKNNLANARVTAASRSKLTDDPDFWIGITDKNDEGR